MAPPKKSQTCKGCTSSQPNLRLRPGAQSTPSLNSRSPKRGGTGQKVSGASNRPALKPVQSTNNIPNNRRIELASTPPSAEAENTIEPRIQTLLRLADCSIDEIFRDFAPSQSETPPQRWAKLYQEATGYSSVVRWYDGPDDESGGDSDDDSSDPPLLSREEPLSDTEIDDKKGKRPVTGKNSPAHALKYPNDQPGEAGPSTLQASSSEATPSAPRQDNKAGDSSDEEEDPDAITPAPYMPDVPADEFGKPVDMVQNPPPNEYTKAFPASKRMPIPKTIRDKPFAYPGAHPHKMKFKECGHMSHVDVVCEETNPGICKQNQQLTLEGRCDLCRVAIAAEASLSRGYKIRRSIRGVGSWINRTARSIARRGRRKPIPKEMRTETSVTDPTASSNQQKGTGSSAAAGPIGTQRSHGHSASGTSKPGSTVGKASHSSDGPSRETPIFEGRGPAPGTAGLPLPNQPMTPEEQARLRRLRGPTGSSVGAGGADPTLHFDTESDNGP
ncbi:hypothetical protein TWF481_004123 [Arthrobotrys musiformis]|uniref:Uncharacterized protein n=1 Tax=Arthrobotrys musiformis TaxID=47236 RepID=A0AAV9WIN9_9PEZI